MYQRADTFTYWLDEMYHSADTKNVTYNLKYQPVDKMYQHVDTNDLIDDSKYHCVDKMYQPVDTNNVADNLKYHRVDTMYQLVDKMYHHADTLHVTDNLEMFGKGKCINALIHFKLPVMPSIKALLHQMFGVVG